VKYSFIIPAFNEEKLIERTLKALREAAVELKGGFEIVVVDDASTDRTGVIAREIGARVIEVKKRQIGPVRNAGAAVAVGEVFVFVDADTIVPRATLLDVERALEDPKVVVGGARLDFDERPAWWGRWSAGFFLFVYFNVKRLAAGGFLFARRDAFLKVGGFDERYFASEELHLSRALKRLGKIKIVENPVVTSARKFRMKSWREHLQLLRHIVRTGPKGFRQREGLDMWYDGQRER
jgi:glycosyltransferase involved in cell wall biosynthesis